MLALLEPLVGQIGRVRFPVQMPLRDTAKMSVIATMGGVDLRAEIGRNPMGFPAHDPRDELQLLLKTHDGIALPIAGERPQQTANPVIGQDGFVKVSQSLAVEGSTAEGRSVSSPAVPVHPAIARSGTDREPIAIWHFASDEFCRHRTIMPTEKRRNCDG